MKSELSHRAKETEVEALLEKLADALVHAAEKLDVAEREMRSASSGRSLSDKHSLGYVSAMFFPSALSPFS